MHIAIVRAPARRRHPAVIASKGLPLAAFPIFLFQSILGCYLASLSNLHTQKINSLATRRGYAKLSALWRERGLPPSSPFS